MKKLAVPLFALGGVAASVHAARQYLEGTSWAVFITGIAITTAFAIALHRALNPVRPKLVLLVGGMLATAICSLFAVREYHSREAIGPFILATELGPKDAYAWYRLANKYLEEGRLKNAEEACKNAIKLSGGEQSHYKLLASIYEKSGEPAKAEAVARIGGFTITSSGP